MTAERHFGRPGPSDPPLKVDVLAEGGAITATKPKRKLDRSLSIVAFAMFLVVVYLFAAVGKVGN